jgi:hypothetical protein
MGVKPKMRGRKLRSGLNWQRALQQIGVKQKDAKQGLNAIQLYLYNKPNKMHYFFT